jgi:hypothetical protein
MNNWLAVIIQAGGSVAFIPIPEPTRYRGGTDFMGPVVVLLASAQTVPTQKFYWRTLPLRLLAEWKELRNA